MNIAIMQPTFNPWIGYFDLIESVDLFVFLDCVQLEKRSWQVRNKIKASNTEFFLSIPIKKTKKRDDLLINNAEINNDGWERKALKTIEYNYKKSPFFDEIFPVINELLNTKNRILSDFNINIIQTISNLIGIKTKFIKASELNDIKGKKDELLLDICIKTNASNYISPQGSSNYLIKNNAGEKFDRKNISLYYFDYNHPIYNQIGKDFIPYLGIVDLLFNEGSKNALEIIRSGHKKFIYYKDFENENK